MRSNNMHVEIYGKDNCIFCEQAKKLCSNIQLEYTYYNLADDMNLKEELAVRMGIMPRSVPQIFIDDVFIGGFVEFKKHVKG